MIQLFSLERSDKMLTLSKSLFALGLGFILSALMGLILLPLLQKINARQTVSNFINKRHLKKNGTPTLGGLIFIIPPLITLFILYLRNSITLNSNLIIIIFVFLSYAALGLIDDLLKIKYHNNKGLSIKIKMLIELFIAIIFYLIYVNNGGSSALEVTLFGLHFEMGWGYPLFVLFLLTATTNAVNITDGLDGLCGGLSAMAFLAYGVISWGSIYITGNQDIAIFSFTLAGSIIGFLLYNSHPAKVFMGDTGSLALGGALASIAILTHHEISLAIIGGVFVIETLSSMIQLIAIKKFSRKVFIKAPLHHHFEELGWSETDIVKLFWVVGFILALGALIYGVWI